MASSPPAHIPSVIFATPPPPQMDPAPQSTQPIYNDMPFLPPSSSQWPVTSTHIHPSDSQMMMTPGQQLPFPSPPQGPAYFIAGQYWPATYVTSPQQYSFPAGSSGFFPGTGSDEYGSYAGGFYPTQPPFTPSVQAAPVIMGSAPQEQQPPPQNPPHAQTRRERKLIRIRDPNQGGRDVTEELMSGVRTGSAPPTPPQTTTSGGEETAGVQTHEENITAGVGPDVETETQLEMLRPLEPEDLHFLQPPSPQDPEGPALSAAERYGRPTAEPDTSQLLFQTLTAIFHAAPTPVLHATPAPPDQEEFPDPVVEMEVVVPPVASDTHENNQAPQSTSTEDNAPEEEFTPPSAPTEEEKEETVSPTFVESTLEEVRKPIKYDREFLLGLQFAPASLVHPEVLPPLSDVVLDKVNKIPLHQLDPSRPSGMDGGPDSTPSLANVCGLSVGGGRGGGPGVGVGGGGPRRSQQTLWKEPKKIITLMSLSDDVLLSKAQNAWKPSVSRDLRGHGGEEIQEEQTKTQELLKRFRSILNKLTPQKFEKLMKQVRELTISSEESLKGVIDLLFEKAISEPNFSVTYANMCHRLMGVKLKSSGVSFHKLLLRRCQNEFEKNKDEDEFLEKKKNEMEAASEEEEKQKMMEELQEARDRTRRRSLGNIKFIGELFKLRMVSQAIVHDCVLKLLKSEEEESLECLCKLLFTIGKDLDYEKAKPRMNQYFHQMEKIIKERKTTSRIRFMLQDVLDLRLNNWVPRRGDQGPKTIDQIHQEAELEEHREQMKVQQALVSNKEVGATPGGRMSGGGRGGRGNPRTAGREAPPQDDGWSTVPISKKSPVDVSHINRIIKRRVDWDNQLLAPGGKHTWGIWGKGCSGGISPKPEDADVKAGAHKASGGLSRSSASRQIPSASVSPVDSNRRAAQRKSSSRERRQNPDRSDHGRQVVHCGSGDFVCKAAIGTDDRSSTERVRRTANVKRAAAADPPPAESLTKPSLTEAALKKKSAATIEEFLHIKDMKEALLCVRDMNSSQLLSVFVRNAVELTLERSAADRKLMGRLLHHLISTGTLPTQQFYKGLHEVLLSAEDMTIDVPFIWLYLAEVITPVLDEGGVTMGEVFREISKPLVPLGRAGVLLTHILSLLCAGMGREKVGTMWREAGLQWRDFLSEDEDVHRFVRDKAKDTSS